MFSVDKVKDLLDQKKMTPYRLSKLIGVNTSHMTRLLNGSITNPQFNLVCRIADALEVSVADLRKGI